MTFEYFALFCEVDRSKEALRHRVRGDHLAFLDARKSRIRFGGPLTDLDGAPETMLIVLRAGSAAEATAFMTDEPYNRSGVFSRITVRPWIHILPETQPGELARSVAAERALPGHLTTSTEQA
jgi:uncharacterized protein YciI